MLPPKKVESLKLNGRVVRLTEWIHQLQNLSRLRLLHTELNQDAIQALGKLPNLTILHMSSDSFKGEELIFKEGSLPSLVLLELHFISDDVFIKFEDGTMSKLELLRIVGWSDQQELSGLRYLTKLKELRLGDLGSCLDQLAEHPNNNVIVMRNILITLPCAPRRSIADRRVEALPGQPSVVGGRRGVVQELGSLSSSP